MLLNDEVMVFELEHVGMCSFYPAMRIVVIENLKLDVSFNEDYSAIKSIKPIKEDDLYGLIFGEVEDGNFQDELLKTVRVLNDVYKI